MTSIERRCSVVAFLSIVAASYVHYILGIVVLWLAISYQTRVERYFERRRDEERGDP